MTEDQIVLIVGGLVLVGLGFHKLWERGWGFRLLRRVVAFIEESPKTKTFLIPFLLAAPPALAGSTSEYPSIAKFFDDHPTVKIVCFFWPVISVPGTYLYERFKPKSFKSTLRLTQLLAVIGHIVGNKSKRFAENLRGIKRGQGAASVFKRITMPDDQIREIINGVWLYFNHEDPKRSTRVVLAEVKPGQKRIHKIICWAPSNRPVRSSLAALQDPNSGFSVAIKSRKIVVVEDTKKELGHGHESRWVQTDKSFADERCSLLCFPVQDDHAEDHPTIYVISVCSDIPGRFPADHQEELGSIMEFFGQRLVLEYYLKCIKENAK